MLRLNSKQNAALSEGLRELANLGGAALVFGRFVSDQRLSWAAVGIGIAIWAILMAFGIGLISGEDK